MECLPPRFLAASNFSESSTKISAEIYHENLRRLSDALDNCCDSDSDVGFGYGYDLHHWRFHSYLAVTRSNFSGDSANQWQTSSLNESVSIRRWVAA